MLCRQRCRGAQAVSESGFRWLSARCDADFGGVLADEMGLGKSLQLISFFWPAMPSASRIEPYRVPGVACVQLDGRVRAIRARAFRGRRGGVVRKSAELRASRHSAAIDALTCWSPHMICFASISTIGRAAACSYVRSTRRKYQKPRGAHDARGESLEADHKFALTGTPMENRLSLWSISTSLMPGLLGPYARASASASESYRGRRRRGGSSAAGHRRPLHAAPLEGRRAHRFA